MRFALSCYKMSELCSFISNLVFSAAEQVSVNRNTLSYSDHSQPVNKV
jgi:hypothetical protein